MMLKEKSPLIDHESLVELSFLTPSISSSSSGSRFTSAIDDGLGRFGSPRVPFANGNSVFFFHEYFSFLEQFDVDSCGLWFLQIFTVCYHQVSWPTFLRT